MTTIATIHIPAASLEAGARNLCPDAFPCDICRDRARAVFEAMVKSWEGMMDVSAKYLPWIILPIPQEARDD